MANSSPHDIALEICRLLVGTLGPLLGSGAAKYSYRAELLKYGTVALKVLDPAFSPERLAREVEAMRRCSHQQIGKLFEFNHITVNGTTYPYLIEEYLSGGSLQDRIRQAGPLGPV